jgi:hypothetical protein
MNTDPSLLRSREPPHRTEGIELESGIALGKAWPHAIVAQ